jgi:hypothetical protein
MLGERKSPPRAMNSGGRLTCKEVNVEQDIPYGYCHCGCGQKTEPTKQTRKRAGVKKGEPQPYAKGHNSRTGKKSPRPSCSVEGCEGERYCRGYCVKHYNRVRSHGTVDLPTYEDRFWGRVTKGDSCWTWRGWHSTEGYGGFTGRDGHSTVYAHRVAYELTTGPIPDGYHIDHLCRNRGCCNPDHLEPVEPVVNWMRGESLTLKNSQKTHCLRGHLLAGDNVYENIRGRQCKACHKHRAMVYNQKKASR